jgi:hypothetical protein
MKPQLKLQQHLFLYFHLLNSLLLHLIHIEILVLGHFLVVLALVEGSLAVNLDVLLAETVFV